MDKMEIFDIIRQVLKRHPYVVKAELFGSLVRGDNKPGSDLDLLVVYDETRPKGLNSFAVFEDLEHFHFENALTADSASIGSAHEE
ncbi:MAG: nucleotidyltransferase domain-containing protein [Deltaproteobacteria bacterium]|jgi:predicted nucleotidyltransferase|nr:nucleotidyltransferase domain-containing protein [Deltaproteobacteria bacterium]